MVQFCSLQQTTCMGGFHGIGRMGRPLRVATRSGGPLAARAADLYASALCRAVGRAWSRLARPVLTRHGIEVGVARASVVSAYEHLLAEGYVESRQGSGTFISSGLTGLASRPRQAPRAIRRAVPASAQTFPEFERSAVQSDARPFNTGRTLIDARTAETWRKLTHRAVRWLGANDLGYTDPAG